VSAVLVHDRRWRSVILVRMARRVLIADDSAVARVSVARRVRADGIEVEEQDSAAGAASVDTADLSCALLDLELGDGLGTDVAVRLREIQDGLPIAFFTGTRTPETVALAATFGPVFAKPDELDHAVDWIRRHAPRRRS
jgi:DNA-binding response OmpR family regulator